MSTYSMTLASRNRKTGAMPVVTASSDTCPATCQLKGGGCYAETGPLRLHWNNVDRGGFGFDELLDRVRRLPRQQVWRYGQAGDLPSSATDVLRLAKANGRRPAIVYTHGRDFETYQTAKVLGFHINLSTDSMSACDKLADTGLSVVTILPADFSRSKDEDLSTFRRRTGSIATRAGRRVAICPASYTETNCLSCRACSKARTRETIIGFPAHGTRKGLIDDKAWAGMSGMRINDGLSLRRQAFLN